MDILFLLLGVAAFMKGNMEVFMFSMFILSYLSIIFNKLNRIEKKIEEKK